MRNIFVVVISILLGIGIGNKIAQINMTDKPTPNLMVVVTAYKGEELIAVDFKSFEFKRYSELTKVKAEFDALSSEYVKVHTFIYYK